MSLPNLPLVQFQAMRDNQSHRYPAPRVYDSESRNRFCKEYEDYKWFISGMRMMCPDNPLCQIELSEWISIRLAKVECDKAVAIERIRVLVERKKMRERKLGESNVLRERNKPGPASPFNSEKYRGQWTGTGSQVPQIVRKGPSALPFSESLGPNIAHRDQWGNCRSLWDAVEPCANIRTETRRDFADVKDVADHGATSRLSYSSSSEPSSETALTLGSSATSWPSPAQSLRTAPHRNYELGYTIAAKRPFHHGQTPTEAASAYRDERPDSSCSSDSEDGYFADEEFFCSV